MCIVLSQTSSIDNNKRNPAAKKMNRGNQSYASPYSKPIEQYPSQSGDYLELDINSSRTHQQPQQPHRQQQHPYYQQRKNTTATRFDNFGGEQNFPAFQSHHGGRFYGIGGGGGRGGGGRGRGGGYNRYFGQDNDESYSAPGDSRFNYSREQHHRYQQQPNWTHGRGGHFRGGRGGRKPHRPIIGKDDIYAAYFHPSMLEDPWQELMERHIAISKSEINLQPSEIEDTPKAMHSSDDEHDAEPASSKV